LRQNVEILFWKQVADIVTSLLSRVYIGVSTPPKSSTLSHERSYDNQMTAVVEEMSLPNSSRWSYGDTTSTSDEEEMIIPSSRRQTYGGTAIISGEEELLLCNSRK
jgi:hypothetical protein